jgi:single-strand DNA-binding protein
MYQKFIAAGNLGQNPELKYTPSGTAVTNFSIAVDETYKDKSGETQKKTEWVNVVCWDKLAENVNQYCKKGSGVLIEGKLQTRSWDDKTTGEKKYKTEIVANTVKFLDKKPAQAEDSSEPF